MPRHWLSIAEFVALSGLSQSTVRRRIDDGSIASAQPGGKGTKLLIPADTLARLAAERSDADAQTPVTMRSAAGGPRPSAVSTAPDPSADPSPRKVSRRGPKPKWQRHL